LKDLQELITNDGTLSLRSLVYNENFHSNIGALKETKNKFINPSKLKRFKNQSIKVLDICFGLGYNSAFLFNELLRQSTKLDWFALEIDKRPLNFSINSNFFKNLWDQKVIEIFESLFKKGNYIDKEFNCNIIWGDARRQIYDIPKEVKFDLIFLDGFSPQKCPEIWTEEFLSKIKQSLNYNGYIITYSSSAAVRKTLIGLGLKIYKIKPKIETSVNWSDGTIAMLSPNFDEYKKNSFLKELSIMELEHLETKASIPYRDPSFDYTSKEILKNRKGEQLVSNLLPTEVWRKKWHMTKAPFSS
tara:strand:+ start:162 stop:1067 length:906 start_codon:yes stop_codon:yes gene_type:complete